MEGRKILIWDGEVMPEGGVDNPWEAERIAEGKRFERVARDMAVAHADIRAVTQIEEVPLSRAEEQRKAVEEVTGGRFEGFEVERDRATIPDTEAALCKLRAMNNREEVMGSGAAGGSFQGQQSLANANRAVPDTEPLMQRQVNQARSALRMLEDHLTGVHQSLMNLGCEVPPLTPPVPGNEVRAVAGILEQWDEVLKEAAVLAERANMLRIALQRVV